MKKNTQIIETPVGKAFWVKTKTADDYGNYAANIMLNSQDGDSLKEQLEKVNFECFERIKAEEGKPIKIKPLPSLFKDAGEGIVQFTAKIPAKGKTWDNHIKFFDSSGDEIDEIPIIWNDSDIKILIKVRDSAVYKGTAGGKFELFGIQIIKLIDNTQAKFKPSAVDGGFKGAKTQAILDAGKKADAKAPPLKPKTKAVNAALSLDDEIPF